MKVIRQARLVRKFALLPVRICGEWIWLRDYWITEIVRVRVG